MRSIKVFTGRVKALSKGWINPKDFCVFITDVHAILNKLVVYKKIIIEKIIPDYP
jgi:hypothetical protein